MSIESALESYPKTVSAKRGPALTLRQLTAADQEIFGEFFRSQPEADLMFLKERMTDPEVIKRWCASDDYEQNLPLLAFVGQQLVAVAILHQHFGGWKRNIGHINVHTHPKFRSQGIGRVMVSEIIEIARQSGLEYLEAEFFDKQEGAIKLFGLLGFSTLVRLEDYVKDMQANTHDYILMGMKLTTEEEYAGMG